MSAAGRGDRAPCRRARHPGRGDADCVNLSQSGRPGEALATLDEAFRLAKEVGDRLNLQRMYNNYASILAVYGSEYVSARAIAAEGVELGRRIGGMGWLVWIVGTLGEIDLALGDLARAEELTRGPRVRARVSRRATREPAVPDPRAGRADERRCRRGGGGIARAHELVREDEEPQGEIPRSWIEAMLASARRSHDEAVEHLRHGVELAERFSVDLAPQLELDLVRALVPRGSTRRPRQLARCSDSGGAHSRVPAPTRPTGCSHAMRPPPSGPCARRPTPRRARHQGGSGANDARPRPGQAARRPRSGPRSSEHAPCWSSATRGTSAGGGRGARLDRWKPVGRRRRGPLLGRPLLHRGGSQDLVASKNCSSRFANSIGRLRATQCPPSISSAVMPSRSVVIRRMKSAGKSRSSRHRRIGSGHRAWPAAARAGPLRRVTGGPGPVAWPRTRARATHRGSRSRFRRGLARGAHGRNPSRTTSRPGVRPATGSCRRRTRGALQGCDRRRAAR